MKIHPAKITETGTVIAIVYRYDTPSRPELSGELWFSIDSRHRDWLRAGPEPAIATLVLLAMSLGEDIEIEQPVSPRFHYGFCQFVAHFDLWLPQKLKPVAIRSPSFSRAPAPRADSVASCFSGGVDSFHALFAHLGDAAPSPDFRLTHLFFAHGFDIPLGNASYHESAAEFSGLGKELGLDFIGLATNARQLLDPHITWVTTHGACIAACALLLSGGIRKFIIPSTNRQSLLFSPCGSNPVTDPMLATESLEIIHHGTHASRIQKILAIAERPEAQQHLRVCWQNVTGKKNCGRCVKCLKTMMPLAITGALEKFSVFPPLPPWSDIDPKCFAPLDISRYAPEQTYADELRALATARGFTGLARS